MKTGGGGYNPPGGLDKSLRRVTDGLTDTETPHDNKDRAMQSVARV